MPFIKTNTISCRYIFVIIFFVVSGSLSADIIFLKNGTKIEGTIVNQDRNTVKIQTENGIQKIEKKSVKRIKYGPVEDPAEKKRREEEKRLKAEEENRRREEEKQRREEEKQRREEEKQRREEEKQREEKEQKRIAKEKAEREAEQAREREKELEQKRREEEELKEERDKQAQKEQKSREREEEKRLKAEEEKKLRRHHFTPILGYSIGRILPITLAIHNTLMDKINVATNILDSGETSTKKRTSISIPLSEDSFSQKTSHIGLNYYYNRYFLQVDYSITKSNPKYNFAGYDYEEEIGVSGWEAFSFGNAEPKKFFHDTKSYLLGYDFYRSNNFDVGIYLGQNTFRENVTYNSIGVMKLTDFMMGPSYNAVLYVLGTDRSGYVRTKGSVAGILFKTRFYDNVALELSFSANKMKGEMRDNNVNLLYNSTTNSIANENFFVNLKNKIVMKEREISFKVDYNFRNYLTLFLSIYSNKSTVAVTEFELESTPDPSMGPFGTVFISKIFAPIMFGDIETKSFMNGIQFGIEKRFDFL